MMRATGGTSTHAIGARVGLTRSPTGALLLWCESRLAALCAGDARDHSLASPELLEDGAQRAAALASGSGRVVHRCYDKGVESATAEPRRLVRLERQWWVPTSERMAPAALAGADLAALSLDRCGAGSRPVST